MLSNPDRLWEFISWNADRLIVEGQFEVALAHALNGLANLLRPDQFHDEVLRLVNLADPEKLKAAGSLLLEPGPFTIYRNIEGEWSSESWSRIAWFTSLERVCRFACFSEPYDEIFSATIDASDILCFANLYSHQDVIAYVTDASPLEMDYREILMLAKEYGIRVHGCVSQPEP